ncbi:MAG TPA: hypothetical protein EYQ01_10675, partial [Nitrospira sp.]|nr:hypothetical protein [Candidatus Manganitrophaceae bacterium]
MVHHTPTKKKKDGVPRGSHEEETDPEAEDSDGGSQNGGTLKFNFADLPDPETMGKAGGSAANAGTAASVPGDGKDATKKAKMKEANNSTSSEGATMLADARVAFRAEVTQVRDVVAMLLQDIDRAVTTEDAMRDDALKAAVAVMEERLDEYHALLLARGEPEIADEAVEAFNESAIEAKKHRRAARRKREILELREDAAKIRNLRVKPSVPQGQALSLKQPTTTKVETSGDEELQVVKKPSAKEEKRTADENFKHVKEVEHQMTAIQRKRPSFIKAKEKS